MVSFGAQKTLFSSHFKKFRKYPRLYYLSLGTGEKDTSLTKELEGFGLYYVWYGRQKYIEYIVYSIDCEEIERHVRERLMNCPSRFIDIYNIYLYIQITKYI